MDTELFSLPDNDPMTASVQAVPVSDVVTAVLGALDRGALQVFVPEWFAGLAPRKAEDLDGFLAGTAAYVKEHQTPA
ncbi:MAG: hypothetical protein ACLP9C_05210 [Acidimicrobiales bacterium]